MKIKCAAKSCTECGKIFTPTGRCAKFCGNKCRGVSRDRVELGKWFLRRCSPQWIGSGGRQKRGAEHYSYTTGIKNFAKNKKDKCERCGSTKYLCVHHRDEDRTNNKSSNAETLCKRCHQIHHGCILRLPKEFTVEERNRQAAILRQNIRVLSKYRKADGTFGRIKPCVVETEEEYHIRLSEGKKKAWARRKANEQSWRTRLLYPKTYEQIFERQ